MECKAATPAGDSANVETPQERGSRDEEAQVRPAESVRLKRKSTCFKHSLDFTKNETLEEIHLFKIVPTKA